MSHKSGKKQNWMEILYRKNSEDSLHKSICLTEGSLDTDETNNSCDHR